MAQVSQLLARLKRDPIADLPIDPRVNQLLEEQKVVWRERLLPPLITLLYLCRDPPGSVQWLVGPNVQMVHRCGQRAHGAVRNQGRMKTVELGRAAGGMEYVHGLAGRRCFAAHIDAVSRHDEGVGMCEEVRVRVCALS